MSVVCSIRRMLSLGALASCALAKTKKFTTSDDLTYAYDYIPAQDDKPTILLVEALSAEGYGVLAPDCMGYGDSSKPTDIEAYKFKTFAGHLDALMESEGLQSVIGVGHDFGSVVLSNAAVYYPDRFDRLAFISVAYSPPGPGFEVDSTNALSQETKGYTQLGYWYFFNSYDTEDVISENLESFFHLLYPATPAIWRQSLSPIGSARSWLSLNTTTELPPWRTEDDKTEFIRQFSQEGAVTAPLNYYRSLMRGVQVADGMEVEEAEKVLKVPVLLVGASQDYAAPADLMEMSTAPYAEAGYEFETLEGGHWLMLEQPEEVNRLLLDFIAKGE